MRIRLQHEPEANDLQLKGQRYYIDYGTDYFLFNYSEVYVHSLKLPKHSSELYFVFQVLL